MEDEGSTVRLVRCPKCENLLPELPEYSVYQCGGCGAVLRGKQWTPAPEKRSLTKSENKNVTRVESSTKENDEFEVGRRKGRTVHEKVPNLTPSSSSRKEKHKILTDYDQSRRRRLDFDQNIYGMSSESQEIRHPFGPVRSRPVGFHRNASTVEKGRFGNLPYSNEGPSGSHFQDLENDRTELLKKVDDLRTQLSRSYPWPHHHPPMPHQLPHHQYLPTAYHAPFLDYNQECSCSQCYNMNWKPIPPKIRSFSSFNSQPNPLTYGQPQLAVTRQHLERYPRKRVIISHGGKHVYRPVSNGAPFISCCNCFELLKIPKKIKLLEMNNKKTMKCAVCSSLISLKLEDSKLVISVSSPVTQPKVNTRKSKSNSLDYDKYGYNFQLTNTEPNLSTSGAEKSDNQSPDSVIDNPSSPVPILESQPDELTKSQRIGQDNNKKSLKDVLVETEIDVSLTEYLNGDVNNDQLRNKKAGNESFFGGLIKNRRNNFSRSDVFVNGQLLTDRKVKQAEKLAGPIHPGEYWYDSLAGFWGVINQPCLGIIPPFIEEFDHQMPKNCAAGNTGVFVNGREINKKDLDLLAGRGLPTAKDRSYIIDISGKVVDEDTGEELDGLGKLAPTVERVKHGFGMKVPKSGF